MISWAETGVEKRMYASTEQRNADIEAAATRPAEELRAWYLRGAGELDVAMDRLTAEQWEHEVITAQLVTRKASDVPWMRAREVFIHAVDLGVGITFADLPDAVQTVVCGHTHMPFVRLVDRRLVLNPGSVGMPYGRSGGAWALLRDGQVSLRHTPIDIEKTCARIVTESTRGAPPG